MNRRGPMKRLLVGCAIAILALIAVPGATAEQTYTDPSGDAPGRVPDVTTTVVSNDTANNVTFRVTTNQTTLAPDQAVAILLDSDLASPPTGPSGVDKLIVFQGNLPVPVLLHWDGTRFVATAAPTLRGSYASNVLTVTINVSDIGGVPTGRVLFGIQSVQFDTAGNFIALDLAPDGIGGAIFLYV